MKKLVTIKGQISAGGVIFQRSDKGTEVALVAVKDKTRWCLPKGAIDKDEAPQITALREVREETGLSGEIVDKIGEVSYWYFLRDENTRFHKTVHFYLLKYVSGSTDDHDWEVNDARWFLIDEAIDKATYKGEKEILQKAKKMIENVSIEGND